MQISYTHGHGMAYREHAPSEALKGVVDRYWFFRSSGPGAEIPVQQCIPLGVSELIVNLSGTTSALVHGQWERMPDVRVVGMQREPLSWRSTGNCLMMGVRLLPEAAIGLFGAPLKVVDPMFMGARELLGARFCEDLEPLREVRDEAEALAVMEDFLLRFVVRADRATERFVSAMRQMRGMGLGFDHRALGDKLFVCDRQAQRLFKEHLGLSPVAYHRIVRFRKAYDHATENTVHRWSDLAFELGYADQAHFNRDFKTFCGVTPGNLQEGQAPFYLLRKRSGGASEGFTFR
ncbi:MAG: AraC family transcriptional regulator [Flavobacteriales bacterium]|nr:AraC family transcriptional regulator [Flavobacteriales bacterium]